MSADPRLVYELTFADVVEILRLVDAAAGVELRLELGGLRLEASPAGAGVPSPAAAAAPAAETPPEAAPPPPRPAPEPVAGVPVKAPLAGIFYRAPAPGAPPYAEVGAWVARGDTLGIVEVMKLFTPVTAPCAGIVRQVLAGDQEAVHIDQVLAVIEPGA